jgi:hypothetical protein
MPIYRASRDTFSSCTRSIPAFAKADPAIVPWVAVKRRLRGAAGEALPADARACTAIAKSTTARTQADATTSRPPIHGFVARAAAVPSRGTAGLGRLIALRLLPVATT